MAPVFPRRTALKLAGAALGGVIAAEVTARPAASAALEPATEGISWPAGQALPSFAQPEYLEVVDLSQASPEEAMLFNTLQGLVARQRPALYGVGLSPTDETWLESLGVSHSPPGDVWSAIERHAHVARGTIIYDPDMPETINVATTLAGLRDAVVAAPSLAPKLASAPYNLKPLEDLRGRFTSRLQAYTWQFENLWPQCTHRMLSGFPPDNIARVALTSDYQQLSSTTFADREVRTVELSPFLGKDAVYVRIGNGGVIYHATVQADGQVIADFDACSDEEMPFVYDGDYTSSRLIAPAMVPESMHYADPPENQYFVYRFAPPAGPRR